MSADQSDSNEALIDGMNENQFQELLEVVVDFKHQIDVKDPKVKDVYNEEKQKADKDLQSTRKSLQSDYPLANSPTPTPPVPKPRRTNSTTAKPIIKFTCGNQETYAKEICDWDADDESSNSSDSKNNTKRVHIPENPKKTDKAIPQMFSLLPQNGDESTYPSLVTGIPLAKKNKMEFDEGIGGVNDGVANFVLQKLLELNNKNEEQGNEAPNLFGVFNDHKEMQLFHRKKSSKGKDLCKDGVQEFELQEIIEKHRDRQSKILVLSGSDGGNATESEGEEQNEPNGVNREKGVTTGREPNKKIDNYLKKFPLQLPSQKSNRSEMTMFQMENEKPNKEENEFKLRTLTYTNRFGKMVQKEIKIKTKKHENEKADQKPENSIGQKPLDEILKYLGVDEDEKKVKNKEKKRKSKESNKDENGGMQNLIEKRGSVDSRKDGENELHDEVFEETIFVDKKKNKPISTQTVSPIVAKPTKTQEIRKENLPLESNQNNQANKDELFITVFKSKKATKSVESAKKFENSKIASQRVPKL